MQTRFEDGFEIVVKGQPKAPDRLMAAMEYARTLPCSACGAAGGEQCQWPPGPSKSIHAARMPKIRIVDPND